MKVPSFEKAVEDGEIVEKSSYHQPDSATLTRSMGPVTCGCEKTTEKGAYRDVVVEMPDSMTVYFYHQTPVVAEKNGEYRLTSGGWQTSTTKERINQYTPRGVKVIQRDYEWYVELPSAVWDSNRVDFEDGMTIPQKPA